MIAFCFSFVTDDCCLNQAGALEGQRKGMEYCEPFGEESKTVGKWQKLSHEIMFLVSGSSEGIWLINQTSWNS